MLSPFFPVGSVVWNLIPNTANDSCVMSGGCGGEAKNPTKTFHIYIRDF